MRFSLRLNNDLSVRQFGDLAVAAEECGFDQLWVSNDLFLRSAPVLQATAALRTERIELGIGLMNPYSMHVAEIAMVAATLDEASGGRFVLGVGSGATDFLSWIGIERKTPLADMRSTVRALRALLAGSSYEPETSNAFVTLREEAYLRFGARFEKGGSRRPIPIYVGAMGPRMLELCGELADGALPLLFPPEHWSTVEPLLERGVSRRSPELGELDAAACVWVSVAPDRAQARAVLADKVAYYGASLSDLLLDRLELERIDFAPVRRALAIDRDPVLARSLVTDDMLRIGVVGTPRDIVDRLRPLVEAGVRHLSFGPPLGPDPVAAVKLLGNEVLPALDR